MSMYRNIIMEIYQFYHITYSVNAILIEFSMELRMVHMVGKDPRIWKIFQEKKNKVFALQMSRLCIKL